jgi:hypothetical protein
MLTRLQERNERRGVTTASSAKGLLCSLATTTTGYRLPCGRGSSVITQFGQLLPTSKDFKDSGSCCGGEALGGRFGTESHSGVCGDWLGWYRAKTVQSRSRYQNTAELVGQKDLTCRRLYN